MRMHGCSDGQACLQASPVQEEHLEKKHLPPKQNAKTKREVLKFAQRQVIVHDVPIAGQAGTSFTQGPFGCEQGKKFRYDGVFHWVFFWFGSGHDEPRCAVMFQPLHCPGRSGGRTREGAT